MMTRMLGLCLWLPRSLLPTPVSTNCKVPGTQALQCCEGVCSCSMLNLKPVSFPLASQYPPPSSDWLPANKHMMQPYWTPPSFNTMKNGLLNGQASSLAHFSWQHQTGSQPKENSQNATSQQTYCRRALVTVKYRCPS